MTSKKSSICAISFCYFTTSAFSMFFSPAVNAGGASISMAPPIDTWSGSKASLSNNTITISKLNIKSASGFNLYNTKILKPCNKLIINAKGISNFVNAENKFFKIDFRKDGGDTDMALTAKDKFNSNDREYVIVGSGPFTYPIKPPLGKGESIDKITFVFWKADVNGNVELEVSCE